MSALAVVFWLAAALITYTYLLYPLLLLLLARAFGKPSNRNTEKPAELPFVSVIFAAYNEQRVIAEKMKNCAAINYPPEKLEILIGCDCCTDSTVEIAEAACLLQARIFDFRERSGKPVVLNRLVPMARGEIVVFSDANITFEPHAVRSLVQQFSDPKVGCVCGELKLRAPSGGASSETTYWRYERFLKRLEGRINALLGANGGIFAIRRELFEPLPPQGIIDDFLIAMSVRGAGYRLVYDTGAVAYEETCASVRDEFHRRVRIGAGNFHALRFTWRQLLPSAGAVAFAYWSHKVFRWIAPFALLILAIASLGLSGHPFYGVFAALTLLFAICGLVGYWLESRNVHRSIFSLPYYFLSMHLALLLGFWRFATTAPSLAWRRTAR